MLRLFDEPPPSFIKEVSWNWDEVVRMGGQVSVQATISSNIISCGLCKMHLDCFGREIPEVSQLEKSLKACFDELQIFGLVSHACLVGASNSDRELAVSPLVGAVLEACSALKKSPSTNTIAIGRAVTQVAVSMKDVLEMRELKPGSYEPTEEVSDQDSTKTQSELQKYDNASGIDLSNDLSPEEMKIAQSAISIVSETLVVVKELIRSVTGLTKQKKSKDKKKIPNDSGDFMYSLESLSKKCHAIGAQIDEVGACLYPPQEVRAMEIALDKISSMIDEIHVELESIKRASDTFLQSCGGLRCSLRLFKSELSCNDAAHLPVKMHKVVLSN